MRPLNSWNTENALIGFEEQRGPELAEQLREVLERWLEYLDLCELRYCDMPVIGLAFTAWGKDGDSVNRANYLYIKREWEDCNALGYWSGGYNSHELYLELEYMTAADLAEIADICQSLDNYPLLDDEIHSQLAIDILEDDWDSYIAGEIRDKLEGIDLRIAHYWEELPSDAQLDLYWEVMRAIGQFPELDTATRVNAWEGDFAQELANRENIQKAANDLISHEVIKLRGLAATLDDLGILDYYDVVDALDRAPALDQEYRDLAALAAWNNGLAKYPGRWTQ